MVFDANGVLIEGDDGGIYRRTSPTDNTGDWLSINSNMQVTEQHDVAWDAVSDVIISGNQDVWYDRADQRFEPDMGQCPDR